MQLLSFSLLFSLLLLSSTPHTHAHNITRILAQHPSLSTFNHYLTVTHLADEINRHTTITVCAIDNSAISALLGKPILTIKNILSLHVLLDYFGTKKLHQIRDGSALAATLFQTTGSASGTTGFVNITDLKGGKVGFSPVGSDIGAFFVKSVEEIPYNISVIQISKVLPSDIAAAPMPSPAELNLTDIMSAHGCKVFADTLVANHEASKTYQDNLEGGLTVFCPIDDAMKAFLPKYKNLTAAAKVSYLEFLGVPVYNTMQMLKSNNGIMSTLATDGAKEKFDVEVQNDGDKVTLKTKISTVQITGTLIDEQPLAVYTTDKVLLPKELFKGARTLAPAPSPDDAADSPKSSKKSKTKKKGPAADEFGGSDSPADSPDDDYSADDTTADDNAGVRVNCGRVVSFLLSLCLVVLLL